jgi:hypothetical protein
MRHHVRQNITSQVRTFTATTPRRIEYRREFSSLEFWFWILEAVDQKTGDRPDKENKKNKKQHVVLDRRIGTEH